jgi:integral membrane protein (TIGR00529 family)
VAFSLGKRATPVIDWIDTIPAIVRILLIFILVLLAIHKKWSLGNAFLAGAMALGLVFGMSFPDIAGSIASSLMHPKTLSLAAVVSLILVFSHSLEKSGQMVRLLDAFRGLIRRPKVSLVIFPALIGLLPMPGGAIFSAPMVKNLGRDHSLTVSQLSYINYWFRHIWEYWWPLYPGILLTTALAHIDLWRLVILFAPMTVVALAIGYWPLRGVVESVAEAVVVRKPLAPFAREMAPIAAVIGFGLIFGLLLSAARLTIVQNIAKEAGLIAALLIAIVWVWHNNGMAWRARWAILKNPALLRMVYMIAAILMFQGVLEDSRAVDLVSREMLRWHIPLMPIVMLLPFLVGSVVGITIAFVGTTFPILISLIHAFGEENLLLPYLMLALTSGFVGVLVSPLHLCLLLSNAYFKTTLLPVYRLMGIPLAALVTAAVLYFLLLRIWM